MVVRDRIFFGIGGGRSGVGRVRSDAGGGELGGASMKGDGRTAVRPYLDGQLPRTRAVTQLRPRLFSLVQCHVLHGSEIFAEQVAYVRVADRRQ